MSAGQPEPDLGEWTPGTDVGGAPVENLCARSWTQTAWPAPETRAGQSG